jgi:hypothetical protein
MVDAETTSRLIEGFQTIDRMRFAPIAQQALAPAFLLSACVAMLSFLMNRLWRILDQFRAHEDDRSTAEARESSARLLARARLIYRAIHSTIAAALAIAAVVLVVFLNMLLGMAHEWGSVLLFLIAVGLIARAFLFLLREVRLAMSEFRALDASDAGSGRKTPD